MPCTYEESYEERRARELEHLRKQIEEDAGVKKQRAELNRATRLLCGLTKNLPTDFDYKKVPGLKKWMKEHAEMDARRKAKK